MALTKTELDSFTHIAIQAAQRGGSVLTDYAQKGFEIHKKDHPINLVTEADLAAEKVVIQSIKQAYPDHQILSEEEGLQAPQNSPLMDY